MNRVKHIWAILNTWCQSNGTNLVLDLGAGELRLEVDDALAQISILADDFIECVKLLLQNLQTVEEEVH
jgi:hypothetical protein